MIAPRAIRTRSTCRMPIGRTEETLTRFCSPMPAWRSARSNALSSLVLLIPLPLVTKKRVGTGISVWRGPTFGRGHVGAGASAPLRFGPGRDRATP